MVKAKQIKDFPNYYITVNGDVYSRNYQHTGRIIKLKPAINGHGYLQVGLCKIGKEYPKRIHKLVADAFIPNLYNKPQVNHKNGVKTDNRIENLEWVTASENILHTFKVLGYKGNKLGKFGKEHNKSKKILQIKNGQVVGEFYGAREVERKTGFKHQNITFCCLHPDYRAGGFYWRYA